MRTPTLRGAALPRATTRPRSTVGRGLSVGQRVITTYFAVAYLIPMLGNVLLRDNVVSSYRAVKTSVFSAVLLIVVFGGAMAWSGMALRIMPRLDLSMLQSHVVRIGRLYAKVRLPIGVVALLLAVGNLGTGLNTYRYVEQSISEYSNPTLLVAVVLNMILTVDLLHWMLVNREHDAHILSRRRLEAVFLAAVLVISANGTVAMMTALALLGFSLAPNMGSSIVFVSRGGYGRRLIRLAGVATLGIGILGASWFAGETIKRRASSQVGSLSEAQSGVADRIVADENFATNYFYYLVERISIHYYSYLFTLEAPAELLNYGESSPLLFPLRTAMFRIDYLLGSPLDLARPSISSISRLNYLLLSANPNRDREGSAPGLVASFSYVLPFPLSLLLCSLYFGMVANLVDRFVANANAGRWSVPGTMLVLLNLQGLFYSPFDLVMVFDDAFVYLTILTGVYLAYVHQIRVEAPVRARRPVIQIVRPALAGKSPLWSRFS